MKSEAQLDVARGLTLISNDRLAVLWWAVKQTRGIIGEIIECGVYRGGSALLIATAAYPQPVHCYDNFGAGLPQPSKIDLHKQGDFGGNTIEEVSAIMPKNVTLHAGLLPLSMGELHHYPIAFAHLDLDLYHSTLDTLNEVYPRMRRGGIIVVDDYDWPETPGVTQAVDEFFADKPEVPLVAAKYQAVIVKL